MIFKKKAEFNPDIDKNPEIGEEELGRPKSDGIRKKTVSSSLAVRPETADPHEEESIIITEPVAHSAKEEEVEVDKIAVPDFKESTKTAQDSDDTFSFSAELLQPKSIKNKLWWGCLWGGIGAILAVFLLFSTVFSRATIILKPRVDSFALPATVVLLDSSVTRTLLEQKVIPAERLEFNKKMSAEFESTGREQIAEKAKGKVKIFNRFSSSPQTLVGGTRFLTDNNLLYRVPKITVVPGAKIEEGKIVPQAVEVELWADQPGKEGNLAGEISLRIPGFKGSAKYEGFYALAASGFSGGFKGEARVVSKDDLKKAEEAVTKQLFDELRREMAQKINADFKTLDGLREIEIVKLDSPEVNSRHDRFSVEATAGGALLIFKEEDLVSIFKEIIFKEDKSRDYVNDSADLVYQIKTVDLAKGKGEIVVSGSLKAKARMAEQELVGLVLGKKEGSIAEALKGRSDISSFSVAFFPPWLSKAPASAVKIKLVIE